MPKVLVTGSEGLIGSALVTSLKRADYAVRCLDLQCHEGHDGHGDVRNKVDVREAVRGCDGIIHLAAISRVVRAQNEPKLCWKTNVEGTQNILRAALQSPNQPWVVYASSREVYGHPQSLPVEEIHPLRPVNIYGRAKLEAEESVLLSREQGLSSAIIRFSNVYGRTTDHQDRVVPAFARGAALGDRLRVDGRDNAFDFTHIDDVITGLLTVVDLLQSSHEQLPPIHLVSGRPTSLGKLAEMAIAAGSGDSEIIDASPREFDVSHFYGNPSRARELLGWETSISIEEGLFDLVRAFEAECPDFASKAI